MDNKAKTFQFGGGTVTYYNVCISCQEELGEPTRAGVLTCPSCKTQKTLSLLANKF